MKEYSFLLESLQTGSIVYHYEESSSVCKEILDSGRLVSASYIGNKDNKYKTRSSKFNGNLDRYFKDRYDRFYKPVLHKEYSGDYGVYFSPTDFFKMNLSLKYLQSYRFKFDIRKIIDKHDVLWQYGKLGPYNKKIIVRVNSVSDYHKLYNDYLSLIESEEQETVDAIESGKLLFLRLPQIIVFAGKDGIPVKRSNLEKK